MNPMTPEQAPQHIPQGDRYFAFLKLQNIGQIVGFVFGLCVIVLAIASYLTSMALSDIFSWVEAYFGLSFVLFFTGFVGLGVYSLLKMHRQDKVAYWYEVGQQAGNGISTLALTYTLLGISLGIGTLAEQPLNAQSIQGLIGDLTAQFSVAFMTTVVGLPTATLLRALVSIKYSAHLNANTYIS